MFPHSDKLYFQHSQEITRLQEQIYQNYQLNQNSALLSLRYHPKHAKQSLTIRTKAYKKGNKELYCGALNHILEIDPIRKIAIVEPRVTMEELVTATLSYDLTPSVIPELKGITVGGAIMGIGAESGSHQWGTFNETCASFEFLTGDGTLIKASPSINSDLYYGLPGSYGSLGPLVLAEIQLVSAKPLVQLKYNVFINPLDAIQFLKDIPTKAAAFDFIDGIIFSKDLAVIIEGNMKDNNTRGDLPLYSTSPFYAEFYYQHVRNGMTKNPKGFQELMELRDYFFRYDLGSFWMGSYLFHPAFSKDFIKGVFKLPNNLDGFDHEKIKKFHSVPYPNSISRTLLRPLMSSKRLCHLLHQAERWVQNHAIIQDFCIPETEALDFFTKIQDNPGIYPIWLLPIKGTQKPQIFAPHLLANENKNMVINFGIYGIPAIPASIQNLTRKLEKDVQELKGRKVLYSRSYYTSEEFWKIYSFKTYELLRMKTHAQNVWNDLTDKVLSA